MMASSLVTILREDYLEDTRSESYLWSDASLLRKLSEAERQACNRANLIFDNTMSITLVSGTRSYTFDSKITVIENVIFDGNVLEKKTREELDRDASSWRTDTGMLDKEVYWTISGRSLSFSRIPDASDDGETITLEVFRLPDSEACSMSYEFEIPEENHRDLIYWALHECYKKQDADSFDQEKSDYYLARFEQIFGPYVTAKVRQHQFESPRSLSLRPKPYMTGSVEEVETW